MATLNLTTEEFADIVMLFLADKAVNPDKVAGNEKFNEFFNRQGSKIKAPLMKYYLDTDSQRRIEYKRIKKAFSGQDNNIHQIRFWASKDRKEKEVKKDGIVKKLIKKLLLKQGLEHEEENQLREWIEEN